MLVKRNELKKNIYLLFFFLYKYLIFKDFCLINYKILNNMFNFNIIINIIEYRYIYIYYFIMLRNKLYYLIKYLNKKIIENKFLTLEERKDE